MKLVTKLMIEKYKIGEIGKDFMGYKLNKGDIYTFHHLIIPRRNGGPYEAWNGAILCGGSSHPYLHLIERLDYEKFMYLTSEMIDENIEGISEKRIKTIDEILRDFEGKFEGRRNKKGKVYIKEEYKRR